MTAAIQPGSTKFRLRNTIVFGAALVTIDAVFVNQGVISALIGVVAMLILVPRASLAKDPALRRLRLAKAAIVLAAALSVLGLNWANNRLARHRAESLIVAVDAFKQKNQRYPTKLDELVPNFIADVPVAKYAFVSSKFYYYASPDSHVLLYMKLPPFGRATYDFEKNKWGYLD